MVAWFFLPPCFTAPARTAFMRCWKHGQSPSLSWGPLHSHTLGANSRVVSGLGCSESEMSKSLGTSTRMSAFHLLGLKVFLTWALTLTKTYLDFFFFFFAVQPLGWKRPKFFLSWHSRAEGASLYASNKPSDFNAWFSYLAFTLSCSLSFCRTSQNSHPIPLSLYPPFPSKSQRSDTLHLQVLSLLLVHTPNSPSAEDLTIKLPPVLLVASGSTCHQESSQPAMCDSL